MKRLNVFFGTQCMFTCPKCETRENEHTPTLYTELRKPHAATDSRPYWKRVSECVDLYSAFIYVKCCADWFICLIVFFYLLRLFNLCLVFFFIYVVLPHTMVK